MRHVFEVRIRRTDRPSNDADVMYLCEVCLKTVSDFAKVTRKKKCASDECDRCGTGEES
jgi:hypothetical protein